MPDITDNSQKLLLKVKALSVFTPSSPINKLEMLKGREKQIQSIMTAILQPGKHSVIFGERGVGKTSLASVLTQILVQVGQTNLLAAKINCDSTDDFSSVWRKVFSQVDFTRSVSSPGFISSATNQTDNLGDALGQSTLTPGVVERFLADLSRDRKVVVIMDEFDKLTNDDAKRSVAHTIKSLSDHHVVATVVLIGVADSISELLREHESIVRNLAQIQMPRLRNEELLLIIEQGVKELNMTISEDASKEIVLLCKGLPHYAHLLALHAVNAAVDSGNLNISIDDVKKGFGPALEDREHSMKEDYLRAVQSVQKKAIFSDLLLACALAECDELGRFAASGAEGPLSKIRKKECKVSDFMKQLNELADPKRGAVLTRKGTSRKFRFRFSDPLMQPYVIIEGLKDGKILEMDLT